MPVTKPVIKEEPSDDVYGNLLGQEEAPDGNIGTVEVQRLETIGAFQVKREVELPGDENLFSSNITGDRIGNLPNFKCHWCHFHSNK